MNFCGNTNQGRCSFLPCYDSLCEKIRCLSPGGGLSRDQAQPSLLAPRFAIQLIVPWVLRDARRPICSDRRITPSRQYFLCYCGFFPHNLAKNPSSISSCTRLLSKNCSGLACLAL